MRPPDTALAATLTPKRSGRGDLSARTNKVGTATRHPSKTNQRFTAVGPSRGVDIADVQCPIVRSRSRSQPGQTAVAGAERAAIRRGDGGDLLIGGKDRYQICRL